MVATVKLLGASRFKIEGNFSDLSYRPISLNLGILVDSSMHLTDDPFVSQLSVGFAVQRPEREVVLKSLSRGFNLKLPLRVMIKELSVISVTNECFHLRVYVENECLLVTCRLSVQLVQSLFLIQPLDYVLQ